MKKKVLILSILYLSLSFLVGCASFGKAMKGLVGGETTPPPAAKANQTKKSQVVGKVDGRRKYKRTDHKTLQEKSQLNADSGSLWIERGQGSYLFAQNTNRLIGDLVNVQIEGQAKKQIETKVKVINDLIDRIKKQQEERKLAAAQKGAANGSEVKKGAAPAPAPAVPAKAEKQDKFEVKTVPSRITEILKDGSYVVQGDQPFMIGKREYKLVVQGIVRQEDFDDQGISAETLLDPKFDIVTNRSKKRR